MNEQILELWNRAADLNARLQAGPNSWETEVNFMNTFAELIVKECIASIENADNGFEDYRNQIEDGMRNHCIDLIKNKFGVEE